MKVLIVGDASSAHTIKWVNGLTESGIDVYLWSLNLTEVIDDFQVPNSKIFSPDLRVRNQEEGSWQKYQYLLQLKHLKKVISKIQPDILHAHYLSSYGLLAALTGFRPLIVSVWGSDIMSFPKRSFFHHKLVSWVITRCDIIQSSGKFLSEVVERFDVRKSKVVNFGLPDYFYAPAESTVKQENIITIGSIKSFEDYYDIPVLINAFSMLRLEKKQYSGNLRLLLVGSGSQESELRKLVHELNIEKFVDFAGKIPYPMIHNYHDLIDIHVCASRRESFGVSILEAMARKRPVVASDIPAFDELVTDKNTGLRYRAGDEHDLFEKLKSVIEDAQLRDRISVNGFNRATAYGLARCLKDQQLIYSELMENRNK